VTAEDLERYLCIHAFHGKSDGVQRLGVEVEMLPLTADGRMSSVEGSGGTAELLRRHGETLGWRERVSTKGAPVFEAPGLGTFTFEPGGQLEFATLPATSGSAVLDVLDDVIPALEAAALACGICLHHVGIDPVNPIETAVMQIQAERYMRMDAHFGTIGPFGARMMRQTAAYQLNLDLGEDPLRRWRLLNALAPYALAIFANSPRYAGRDTGHRSYRAHVWRTLDSARTGVFDACTVEEYLQFALDAPAVLMAGPNGAARPFGELLGTRAAQPGAWSEHLSTLFPEVRPKGYLEVRSIDAVPPPLYPAPLVLLSGLTYDPESCACAEAIAGTPDLDLLVRAGRDALADPAIGRVAVELAELALDGCARLGSNFLEPRHLARATDFFEHYTFRGRTPADDQVANDNTAGMVAI
jgi:glutamate--cysteine ligase